MAKSKVYGWSLFTSSVMMATGAALPAFAQEQGPRVEELVVTAQQQQQRLQHGVRLEKLTTFMSTMRDLLTAARYQADRVRIDPSVVRGLAYYTGPVFEAELTFEIKDEDGRAVRFGSIGGGGRYDDLVERFLGKKVPATGVSIGVSRLAAALKAKGLAGGAQSEGPVVVLVLDRDQLPGYQAMVSELRGHGVRAELYLGEAGMKAQMKYADRRGAPLIVIEGSNERASGQLTIKDLRLGAKLSADIASREEWAKAKDGQQWTITRSDLVNNIKAKLGATGA